MQLAQADLIVERALDVVRRGGDEIHEALQELPAPIYITDTDGVISWFNEACVGFAGRRPAVGKDRWCVSWKLYTEAGRALPHDRCPMAVAIGEKRPVRGAYAIAERPDGTRVTFTPFPTPLLDDHGELVGAINILIDVTETRQAAELRAQAERCRRLAGDLGDRQAVTALRTMAAEYEAKAMDLEDRAQVLTH